MSLEIISSIDGRNMAGALTSSLGSFCKHVTSLTLDEASMEERDTSRVCVLILTPLLGNEILNKPSSSIKSVFIHSSTTIILNYLDSKDRKPVSEKITKLGDGFDKLTEFDLKLDEENWFMAEGKIKSMLSKLSKTRTSLPTVQKYLFHPNCISKGSSRVFIILLEENTGVKSVNVRNDEHNIDITATKVRNEVWEFDTKDLNSGEYEFKVVVDGKHIGSTTLRVEAIFTSVQTLLYDAIQQQSADYIAELLDIDKGNLDHELADMLSGYSSSFRKLLLKLLQQGEKSSKGTTFPTLLHFCGANGLDDSAKYFMSKFPNDLNEKNIAGLTPALMAKKHNFKKTKELMTQYRPKSYPEEHDGSDSDDLEVFPSPLQAKGFPRRIDSGISQGPSAESIHSQRSSSSSDSLSTGKKYSTVSNQYQFSVRREHPYCEIDSEESAPMRFVKKDNYSPPWDESPLPSGPMPGSGSLPRMSSLEHGPPTRRVASISQLPTGQMPTGSLPRMTSPAHGTQTRRISDSTNL